MQDAKNNALDAERRERELCEHRNADCEDLNLHYWKCNACGGVFHYNSHDQHIHNEVRKNETK
jgi:hypothetical protein